ncbi:MAG: hypothetical protein EPO40_21680 [Myxococcaceae bacterium]|nr:MAG: hypothetical protein EPO40_21680 [Myxococcaceae bacterium]
MPRTSSTGPSASCRHPSPPSLAPGPIGSLPGVYEAFRVPAIRHRAWNSWLSVGASPAAPVLPDGLLRGGLLRGGLLRWGLLRGGLLRWGLLRGRLLRRADLRGRLLRRADLRGRLLRRADLRGRLLRRADLRGGLLRRADLRGGLLRDTGLRGGLAGGALGAGRAPAGGLPGGLGGRPGGGLPAGLRGRRLGYFDQARDAAPRAVGDGQRRRLDLRAVVGDLRLTVAGLQHRGWRECHGPHGIGLDHLELRGLEGSHLAEVGPPRRAPVGRRLVDGRATVVPTALVDATGVQLGRAAVAVELVSPPLFGAPGVPAHPLLHRRTAVESGAHAREIHVDALVLVAVYLIRHATLLVVSGVHVLHR